MKVTTEKYRLTRIRNNADTNNRKLIRQIAFAVEARAKAKSPVDTGANRASIYVNFGEGETGDGPLELPNPPKDAANIGPSTEYGIYLELGTRNMQAQPYLGPALREVVNLVNQMGDVLIE